MDWRIEHYKEKCTDPLEFLRHFRCTTEPIGGSTELDENGDLVDWDAAVVAIEKAQVKKLNSVWHDASEVPEFDINGVTDFIVSSYYGHIMGEAHSYSSDSWSAHLGFGDRREFRWAYEKDLINFG